jgi:II/X family phage/plasmid replication protein
MIDTIKFLIPFDDQPLRDLLKGNLMRFKKDNVKTGEVEFEFFSSNIKLGSYNRTVAIKSTNVPQGFFVEFSVPKYAKGNNVEMIYPHELPAIMAQLYDDLCTFMSYKLPDFQSWPVYRLDVCYNWLFKDENEATYAMDFLRRIDFPRKKKSVYNTSVMYIGSAYTVKFYAKGTEFKKNDFNKIDINRATSLQAWADRIVRFEVNLRRTYLQDFFKLEKVYLKDVIDDQVILDILKFYLEKKAFFYLNANSMTDENIKQILFNKYTKQKAVRLYQFYKDFYFDTEMKDMFLRGGLNRTTIYRYKKDLKEAGIGISSEKMPENKNILSQLVIPSTYSQFDLVDYPFDKG